MKSTKYKRVTDAYLALKKTVLKGAPKWKSFAYITIPLTDYYIYNNNRALIFEVLKEGCHCYQTTLMK